MPLEALAAQRRAPGAADAAGDFATLRRWSALARGSPFSIDTACIAGTALAQQTSPPPARGSDEDSSPTFTVSDLPVGDLSASSSMRYALYPPDTQPGVRKSLAQKVGEEKPDILLLTGDMPFHGSSADDWKVYDQETALWAQERLRIYPTIGNHEGLPDPRSELRNYFAAYPQIDHRRWYSVQMGNIYLITLDSQ
jgi:hypothetical protein